MKKSTFIATKALINKWGWNFVESPMQKFIKPIYLFVMLCLMTGSSTFYSQISLQISSENSTFCNGQEVTFTSAISGLLADGSSVGTINMTANGPFNQSLTLNCGQNYNVNVTGIYSVWSDAQCNGGNCANGGCNRYFDVEFLYDATTGVQQNALNRIAAPYNNIIPNVLGSSPTNTYNYNLQSDGSLFNVIFVDEFPPGTPAYSNNCGSLTYTITAAPTTFTYVWNFGDGSLEVVTTDPTPPAHIYNLTDPSVAQTYTVTCTATPDNLTQNDFSSCTFTASMDITINPSPTVTITGDNVIYENEVITLTTNVTNETSFAWQDGSQQNQLDVDNSNYQNQNETYTVTAVNGDCNATATHDITLSTFTVDKQQTVQGYVTGSSYVFQIVDYSITITNNSTSVESYSVYDNIPSNLILQSINTPLTTIGSDIGVSNLVMQPFQTSTLTYSGYYNVFSDEETQCIEQVPNVVSVTNDVSQIVKDDQTEMCIVFGCPGHIEGENYLDAGLINQEQLFTVSYRQHKTFSNVSKIAFRIYYPDFLTLVPEGDPIQDGGFSPLLQNATIDFQNYEIPVLNQHTKTTDIFVEFVDHPIGYGTGIIRVFDLKFKTNIPDLNILTNNAYNIGVISILPSVNSTINAVNEVTIDQITEDNVQQSLSLLTQMDVVEIINHHTVTNMESSDFDVVINPCDNMVHVKALTQTGSHRWQFNDLLQPFVPIWGGKEFSHQYLEPGTYSIDHLFVNEYGQTSSTTKQITISPVAFDYPSGMTITSPSQTITDLNNDGFIRVRGPVTIASGVTYQINNKTIEFADDLIPDPDDLPRTHSGIIVNRNSTLNLNNSTLRSVSTCPTSMWQGIQVLGDQPVIIVAEPGVNQSKGQGQINQPLQHGKINTSNSVIEEARIAIAAYKVSVAFGEQFEYGRGIINANTTTFRNNYISVGFRGRTFVENASTIKACVFTNTADLKDVVLFPSQGIKTYVQLDQVKNVQILANAFYGRTSYAPEKRGNGIVSYDAAYTVTSANTSIQQGASPTPNSFAHLTKGIDVYSTGGANKVVRVKNNSFNQVVQGITANGSNFDEISFNTFNVPLGSETLDSWGINLYKSAGFTCTENTFNSAQSNPYTFGLLSRSTMLASGQVYKNTFSGRFFSATQAEQENTHLQIKCNTYSGVNNFDWTVTSGVLANQGECSIDPTTPAGNIFGICNDHDESQIWKNPIVPDFAYRTHPNRAPVCYTPTIFVEDCGINANTNSCPTIVSNPCPNCSNVARNQFTNAAPGLERDRLRAEVIRLLAQEGNKQALIDFITQQGSVPEDVNILIPTHIENGDCQQARALLNLYDRSTAEKDNFFKLYDVLTSLCETGRGRAEISTTERATLQNVQSSETFVAVNAESMLAEVDQIGKFRVPERVGGFRGSVDNFIPTANQENDLSVYPNPSEEQIVVSNTNKTNSEIIISDALGRIHFNGNLNEANLYQLSLSLNKGMYVVKQIAEDGQLSTKNILIQD